MARRAIIPILLAYGLIMAGFVTLRGELVSLAVPFILLLLVGFWMAPGEPSLEIERTLSSQRTTPDSPVSVKLTVRNNGRSLKILQMEDTLPHGLQLHQGSNCHLIASPSGSTYSWEYSIKGPRGFYSFSSISVKASDPFGFFVRQMKCVIFSQLFIIPTVLRIHKIPIRPRRTNVYSGTIPAHQGGPGVEFFGIREYERGDPQSWINWNTSARYPQRLFSNQFEQERMADVGIVLDGRIRTNQLRKERSLFEYSIQAAAALAETFLLQGNRVGLLVYGHHLSWTFPGYGKLQRELILQALARAGLGGSHIFTDLGNIPTQLFPLHSQIVLVSPLASDDFGMLLQLHTRGYKIMVVSPDPVSFELSYLPNAPAISLAGRIVRIERKELLQKLNHAGVQVLDWNVSRPFDLAVSATFYRSINWIRELEK